MSRAARLLDLIQALRRRRHAVPAALLAAEVGVSLRTIYRDIDTLIAQGAPIEGEAGLGYVLRPGFTLPPLMFDKDEIDALILGLRLVAERGDPGLERAAADALSKITAVLPDGMENVAAISGLLAGPSNPRARTFIAVVRESIRAECKLNVRYADKTGVVTERTVWPVALGFFDTAEVLVAWCETREGFRHFRLDRMAAAERLEQRIPKRRQILLADWRSLEGIDGRDAPC